MSKRDYYSVLGVSKTASDDELKKAYRKRVMHLHPDRNPNASKEEFQEVQQAYSVLSDSDKRKAYDQFGHAAFEQSQASGFSNAGTYDFGDIFGDLGNVFGDIFGNRRGSSSTRAQRGSDLRYSLSINLEHVIFGYNTSIKVPRLGRCQSCQGTGSKDGAKPVTCKTCGGAGQVYLQHGPFNIQQTCPDCQGQGQRISSPCVVCRGSGQVKEMRTISIHIPSGIDEGDQIRLEGEGEAGVRGGSTGDLYVQVHINPHALFKRKEHDLYVEMPISYLTAVLGGDVEVPTIDSTVRVQVPSGTPNGKVLKLRGKGIPKMHSRGAGDLFLTLIIETPVHLNKDQINLMKQLEQSLSVSNTHYPKAKAWIKEMKNFFTSKS